MRPPNLDRRTARPFGMTTRQLVAIALIGTMVALSKAFTRTPLHIPGHSGMVWIGLMIVGRGMIPRRGAGTLIGFVAGVLAVFLAPGKEGVFLWLKYFAPGLTLDLLAPLIAGRFDNPLAAGIAGAIAHVTKLVAALVLGILLGLPAGFLAYGLGITAITHAAFGAVGGVLGALLVARLKRMDLPQFRALRELPAEDRAAS